MHPADPASISDLHTAYARYLTGRKSGEDLSSFRDFISTAAILLTTVLSETWKPIALSGHARGPSVFARDSLLPD
jgi:hypothetical protein